MTAFLFLLRKECHRFMKVLVQTVLTPLISSTLYLLIFGVSLGSQIQMPDGSTGENYLAFLIPGLMMMGLMNNAFQNSSSSLVSSKFTGDIEDLGTVPLSRNNIIWALSLASVVRGTLVAAMTLLAGQIFFFVQYGHLLSVEHPLWLFYFLLIGGLVFGQMGMMTAFWAKTFDQLSAVSTFVILPLTYLGGVFISIHQLHPVWQTISLLNPLFYFINGLRYSVLGKADVEVWQAAGLATLSLAIMYVLAHRLFSKISFSRW
ncbi:MAG: ABC transporter permease [Pseudobdellovibrionaceae bacterium]